MLDAELAEIVGNLRAIGADIADVEVKKGQRRPAEVPARDVVGVFQYARGGHHPRTG